ncbi:hypothetical protein [Streptomyces achromogenes]|uniref:hypothetical protein n=1 Tax=Streptomyces achromogenes TaxID=67255 RepID=UPI00367B8AE1
MTARLEMLGEDGEWHKVPGVTSIELNQEQPDDDPLPDRDPWRRHDALDALAYSMPRLASTVEVVLPVWAPYFEEALTAVRRAAESMSRAMEQASGWGRVIDQDGQAVRPAWQSPYGPPPRRR